MRCPKWKNSALFQDVFKRKRSSDLCFTGYPESSIAIIKMLGLL
jgi:hypothetical protein